MQTSYVCLLFGLVMAKEATALVSSDGTGRLPAMGWNSWNEYGCNISEDVFITVGRQLNALGLKDLGYEYVNIDDCWSDRQKRRDPITKEIIPDVRKFPRGISHTAGLIHDLGLKLGIYSDAGLCSTEPESPPSYSTFGFSVTNECGRYGHLRGLRWLSGVRGDRRCHFQQVGC
jgi:alpha galactosidase A-like protein